MDHLLKRFSSALVITTIPRAILQRASVEREGGGVTSPFRRPHRKLPTHRQKEHPGCGALAPTTLSSSQVASEPNPFKAGNAISVLLLSYHCQPEVHPESPLQIIVPHRCMAADSPNTICKDLWRTQIPCECRAFSLLFYSIRRVFFCSQQARSFHFWDIEFHSLLFSSFPRLLKCVSVLHCLSQPLFFSWSWWIWIGKSLVPASVVFLR